MEKRNDNTQGLFTDERPGIRGFVALILFVLIFSGALQNVPVLKALDFNNMVGAFGTIAGAEGNFQGSGGIGSKEGFMVAFAQLPLLMLAMGIVELATANKALLAAKILMEKVNNFMAGGNKALIPIISAGCVLGCYSNLVVEQVAPLGDETVATLASAVSMIGLLLLSKTLKKRWIKDWVLSIAMLLGMMLVIILP